MQILLMLACARLENTALLIFARARALRSPLARLAGVAALRRRAGW